jgi:hypothetical protein
LHGVMALALLSAPSAAQDLPSGGGSVPALRRGSDGQIEVAPTTAASPKLSARPRRGDRGSAPAAEPNSKAPEFRATAAPRTPQPLINITPAVPRISDTTPRGAVVASYSVVMSDGSPFTGIVRFGAPYYDGQKVFALSDNKIIVNPNGPGVRSGKSTVTHHVTLETVP